MKKSLQKSKHSVTQKQITKVKEFTYENKKYIARLYKKKGIACVYGEILLKSDEKQELNMKGIAREFLRPFGINIPTTPNVNTHDAIRILIKTLEQESQGSDNTQIKVQTKGLYVVKVQFGSKNQILRVPVR